MSTRQGHCVALFDTVTQAMKAEKILKEAGIPYKVIPIPRTISTDCGVCLRFPTELTDTVLSTLESKVPVKEVREI